MSKGDDGATQQKIFNKNLAKQAMINYTIPTTGGKKQDQLRKHPPKNDS